MSTEAAKAFLERMKSDPKFAQLIIESKSVEELKAQLKKADIKMTDAQIQEIKSTLTAEGLTKVPGGSIEVCESASWCPAGIQSLAPLGY